MLARGDYYRVPDFFQELNRFNREMNKWFGESFRPERSGVFPSLNIYDDTEAFVVRAEIPGVDPNSIEVDAAARSLTIKGERPKLEQDNKRSFHRRERGHGAFSRSLTLPQEIEPDKVRAEYKQGVLEIVLPKSENTKPRKIEIKQA